MWLCGERGNPLGRQVFVSSGPICVLLLPQQAPTRAPLVVWLGCSPRRMGKFAYF
jgi:hypothetical protein